LLTVEQVLACSRKLYELKPDTVWIPETWGMENFSMLSMASRENSFSKIGSSIVNIYSRSPSLIAMGAATVDTISNKRLVLGLGTSSQPLVEDFHGGKLESPLKRMKEYVEIIRLILGGKTINYSGEIFSLKNFSLLIKPPRDSIPIYLAAVNQKMVELTWKIADGVIFYLRPKSEIKSTLEKMQNQKKIDTMKATNEALDAGIAATKPGNTADDVAQKFWGVLDKYGIKKDSRTGYSIGIGYPPDWGEQTLNISKGDKTVLQPNVTFHMIAVMQFGEWGVEASESVRVSEKGSELFCNLSRELHIKE